MKTLTNKQAFTLVEILVVLIIMGFLASLVMPTFRNTISETQASLNKSQMQTIKKASLEFYKDTGFVADNISLLIYPWEKCDVKESNWDDSNSSDTCINMIAFIDKHYKFYDDSNIPDSWRKTGIGDNGYDNKREKALSDIIKEKLDANIGWKGSYLGGNEILKENINIKKLGDSSDEEKNLYFFSEDDSNIYYKDYEKTDSLNDIDSSWDKNKAAESLYPIFAQNFDGDRHTSGTSQTIKMDKLYENAKYAKADGSDRKSTFFGTMTLLDPYGTPYEIQIPTSESIENAGETYDHDNDDPDDDGLDKDGNTATAKIAKPRSYYARIVSFGKNRRRDTPIDVLDIEYTYPGYDDSVLYLFNKHQLKNYFHPENEDK